jgi:hypothetical protein
MFINFEYTPVANPAARRVIIRSELALTGQGVVIREEMTPDMVRRYAADLEKIATDMEAHIARKNSMEAIKENLRANRVIDAIKEVRARFNVGLREAKDIVEMMCDYKEGR